MRCFYIKRERCDLCVGASEKLIDLSAISVPMQVTCGDKDPYLNYDPVNLCPDSLPEGSVLEIISGASHVAMIEKPFYHDFQTRLMNHLSA